MIDITRGKQFKKDFDKLSPLIKEIFATRLKLYIEDPRNSLLKKHPLHGEYLGCFSINITGDYRLIFKYRSNSLIELQRIGTHSQLYK